MGRSKMPTRLGNTGKKKKLRGSDLGEIMILNHGHGVARKDTVKNLSLFMKAYEKSGYAWHSFSGNSTVQWGEWSITG